MIVHRKKTIKNGLSISISMFAFIVKILVTITFDTTLTILKKKKKNRTEILYYHVDTAICTPARVQYTNGGRGGEINSIFNICKITRYSQRSKFRKR